MAKGTGTSSVLPYSAVVGQDRLKTALELAYVEPALGGVLLSGDRGTGKSTVARAFALMMRGKLPVTLPINVTEDRVVGGWDIEAMTAGASRFQPGLLEEADGGMLYVDEVNLLDDHIVNIILDVTAGSILDIQREGRTDRKHLAFTLVGTMNPEEGGLRPQLLDRFGLMVSVTTETEKRGEVLAQMLRWDAARGTPKHPFLADMAARNAARKKELTAARKRKPDVPEALLDPIVALVTRLDLDGYRGERTLLLAARALAALRGDAAVTARHVADVAPMALQHRQKNAADLYVNAWGPAQEAILQECLG